MTGVPFPRGQLLRIYGNKLKLHPVCYLCEASVLRVTHTVLLICVSKHAFNLLFSLPVEFFVHSHMPHMLRHLHIILSDMA